MKKLSRLLALCLALLLALSGIAMAEETDTAPQATEPVAPETTDAPAQEPVQENPVLLTMDGEDVTKATIDEMMAFLLSNRYIASDKEYATAIDYWLQDQVIFAKIQELGLDQFTAEEEEAFLADAQVEWDSYIEQYVSQNLSEDTDEAREKARADGAAYFQAYGISLEALADNLKMNASIEKLKNKLLEGKDLTSTDEEIRQVFEEYAAQDQAMYEGNIPLYEWRGQYSWYKPEGYRGIIHILLSVDEELLKKYQDLQVAYEEGLSNEETGDQGDTEGEAEGEAEAEPTQAPVTQADVDAALNAILESRAKDIEDIYARLEKGESFEALIAEYGTDPGMQDENLLKNGYEVHPDAASRWDPAFVSAVFSEKMQKPGDVSDPSVGMYGIYITKYLRDVPGGYVELTDDIRAQIEAYLTNVKTNKVYNDALEAWKGEHTIVYHQEAINAVSGIVPAAEEVEPAATEVVPAATEE